MSVFFGTFPNFCLGWFSNVCIGTFPIGMFACESNVNGSQMSLGWTPAGSTGGTPKWETKSQRLGRPEAVQCLATWIPHVSWTEPSRIYGKDPKLRKWNLNFVARSRAVQALIRHHFGASLESGKSRGALIANFVRLNGVFSSDRPSLRFLPGISEISVKF